MSVTANQVTIAIERAEFEAAHPNFSHSRHVTHGTYCAWVEDRWQGWLAARSVPRELVALCERMDAIWITYDITSITAQHILKHQPERIGVDILPVYQVKKEKKL